jgi:hypothetical protein
MKVYIFLTKTCFFSKIKKYIREEENKANIVEKKWQKNGDFSDSFISSSQLHYESWSQNQYRSIIIYITHRVVVRITDDHAVRKYTVHSFSRGGGGSLHCVEVRDSYRCLKYWVDAKKNSWWWKWLECARKMASIPYKSVTNCCCGCIRRSQFLERCITGVWW